jgi:aminoglycoside 6-adenylyltransferase
MRSEHEMFDLILDTARNDERIRAVILNGSRANLNAPRDIFQDFDIIYIVNDVQPFTNNLEWIKRFGEMMILQMPEENIHPSCFVYLMQFMDGNRIDLTLFPLAYLNELPRDSLSVLLLDKDGIMAPFPPPDESSYLPHPPTTKEFLDCCNEFWWVSPYVAKGLWREELPYAKYMLDDLVREQLMRMLTWYIGVNTGFLLNPGKNGKYFKKYLSPEFWEIFLHTYAGANDADNWEALLVMSRLFRISARSVAEHFGYDYPQEDDRRVSAYLAQIHSLPKDALEIY